MFAGYSPDTELVKDIAKLNEYGYVITDSSQKTTIDGLYAAGDVCIKPLRQVVTATGDGAISATELEKYVAEMQRKTGLHPKPPVTRTTDVKHASEMTKSVDDTGELFTAEMRQQLDTVFHRMERPLLLKLSLDNRPVSEELEQFITALVALSDKLTMEVADRQASETFAPCVEVCLIDGTPTGLAFHGIPSGHEFTSFVLGLYNAAGPGQAIDEDTKRQIEAITEAVDIMILVTLSCTMCPDLVVATQRIAAESPLVTAHVYDIRHFEELKNRYQVMSVPCLAIGEKVFFGKKNIHQILDPSFKLTPILCAAK